MSNDVDDISDAADIPDDALRAYYEDAADVWATMSTFDDAESLIVPGTSSSGERAWYQYDDGQPLPDLPDDVDADDAVAGRPYSARADRDEIVDELLSWDYRLPHLTINYQQRGLDDWGTKVFEDDDNRWIGGRPLPGYGDIDAVALFADVDFSADAKTRPVDDATRDRVETILEHWRDAYAGVVDDRDAVGILDSVGGTYVMLRPAVTRPIAEFAAAELESAERQQLMKEIQARWRAFNTDVDDAADDWDAFEQDGDTNKNRLFKAPLAVHKRLPGVVTPIDTDDVAFQFTHFDDVDAELIDDVNDWAQWFTDDVDAADDWAGQLIATLFDDADADDWRDAIRDWADEQEQTDSTAQTQTLEDIDIDAKELAGDIQFVSERGAVWDAIATLDCEDVASELNIISTSERAQNDDVTRIEVNWRSSDSEDSAMVGDDAFTDMDGMESKGGAANLVAYTLIGSSNQEPENWRSNADHIETVLDWFIANYADDVPVYIPEKGTEYDADGETKQFNRTPNWALRRVAELLDIAPAVAFDNETDACVIPSLYNRILAVLDAADVEHNRDYQDVRVDADGDDVTASELDVDVDDIIAQSPSDIPTDGAGRSSDAPEQSEGAETWTDRYGIEDRDSVDEQTKNVAVPGVDLQWLELWDGRAGWGWTYQYYDDDGQEQTGYEFVLNADIELLSRLDYPERREQQTEWRVRINPTVEGEPRREITLTPAAFNSSRELRDELIGQTESVVFNSQGKGAKAVNELKQLVHAQDAPRRKAHEKIELVTDDDRAVFVTPNGTIDADGWVEQPEHVFEAVADGVQGDWRAAPDVVDEPDDELVADVCELLPRIRDDREQWLSMMGFAFASALRPVLFDQPASRVNTWNMMHVSGKSGAGKSAVAKTLSGALGMNSKSTTGAEKTSHAQEHMFSATNGMPVAMDEYNPKNWANWKADAFHEHLKKSTDAQSIEKGNADQSLTEYRFEVSPIVLGEQQLPESMPALPRRAVEVTLQTLSTARGTDTAERFNTLRGLSDDDWGLGLHHHAVAFWSYVADAAESPIDVVNDWHQTNDWLREELDDRDIDIDAELPRAMHQQGLQTVAFGLRRWRAFAVDAGADPSLLFDDADIVDTLEHLIQEKTGEHAASVDNENAMLELLGDAAAIRTAGDEYTDEQQEYVACDEHYTIVNYYTEDRTELRLHLKSVLTQLSKFSRDYGIDATLYQRSDYYRWFKSAAENPDSIVTDATQRTHVGNSQKRCVAIDFEKMTQRLDVHPDDLLPAWMDGNDERSDVDDDEEDDDGEDDDVDLLSIGDIGSDTHVQASTIGTVEIQKWDGLGENQDAPHFTATLVDDTGDAKLVIWDESNMPDIIASDGTIDADALLVKRATVGEYEGELQLTVGEQTIVQPAQAGAGDTSPLDAGDNQQLASTDGGSPDIEGAKGKLKQFIKQDCDSGDKLTPAIIAGTEAVDASPDDTDDIDDALQALADAGTLERYEDRYEVI
jgi:hypothetical protein